MTDRPITPPPEMVEQWRREPEYADGTKPKTMVMMTADRLMLLSEKSAQYGADQELESCIELLKADGYKALVRDLRTARRPKPPTLKEQALKALKVLPTPEGQVTLDITDLNTIRRALEALPND
jgi:hypothetical protein